MNAFYFQFGRIVCVTGGVILAVAVLGALAWVIAIAAESCFERFLTATGARGGWSQWKACRRLFFRWCVHQVRTRGTDFNAICDRRELADALKTYDPKNREHWQEWLDTPHLD